MKDWTLVLAAVILTTLIFALGSQADWLSETKQIAADLGVVEFCGDYRATPAGYWCVGRDGHNLYEFNKASRQLDQLCDGGLDRITILPDGAPAARWSGDPDTALWWTPLGDGHCKAVRVTVQ